MSNDPITEGVSTALLLMRKTNMVFPAISWPLVAARCLCVGTRVRSCLEPATAEEIEPIFLQLTRGCEDRASPLPGTLEKALRPFGWPLGWKMGFPFHFPD